MAQNIRKKNLYENIDIIQTELMGVWLAEGTSDPWRTLSEDCRDCTKIMLY